MRFTTLLSIALALVGLTACGASSEATRGDEMDMNMKSSGVLMAPEEDGTLDELSEEVDDDDEYFGEDEAILEEDDEVAPVDRVEPQTLSTMGTEVTPAQIPAEQRPQPADIGDVRLQADPAGEQSPAKPGTQPRDIP